MKPAPDAKLLARFTAPLPSMAERMAKGKGLREQAVARFAEAYADQTNRDYDALVKAAKEQRIPVAKTA
jgi:uncharacterized protein DUF2252